MEIIAEKREKFGKALKSLKNEGLVPAVIFGKGMESIAISLNYNEFKKLFQQAGETDLIDINLDSKKHKVLVKNVQFDPVTDAMIHVEFYKPDLTEKIKAQVPVEVIGEETNELIKAGEAMVLLLMQEITVEALPEDLPHNFTIDVSTMNEVGAAVTIADLGYDKTKVTIPELDPEEAVVRIDEVKIVEEVEEAPVSEEEALQNLEATGEKPAEEGEEGAESAEDKE